MRKGQLLRTGLHLPGEGGGTQIWNKCPGILSVYTGYVKTAQSFLSLTFKQSFHTQNWFILPYCQNVLKMRAKLAEIVNLCLIKRTNGHRGVGFVQNKGVIWQVGYRMPLGLFFLLSVRGRGPLLRVLRAGFGPRAAIWEGLLLRSTERLYRVWILRRPHTQWPLFFRNVANS